MKSLKYGSLALAVLGLSRGVVFAGGHHFRHHTTTITTTTRGAPVLLAPAAQPMFFTTGTVTTVPTFITPTMAPAAVPFVFTQAQPTAPVASPTVAYYYYPAQTSAPVAPTAIVAPSMLSPLSGAMPVANASGQAAAPFALPAGGGTAEQSRTGRIFQKLREFALNNHLDRATLMAEVRKVGLGLLRAELAQYGLGGLVPSPSDQNAIEDMVNRVIKEKFGQGTGDEAIAEPGPGGNQFVFQGPVTLSFPNVQSVQIQAPSVTNGTLPPANLPPAVGNPAGNAAAPAAPLITPPPPAPTTPPIKP